MMNFDVVIVGGGMVGAALACALSHSSLNIALIDAAHVDLTNDPRLIALNDSSVSFLKNIGVWQELSERAAKISEVHVSDQGKFGKVNLTAATLGIDALGYVIPAKYINQTLHKTLTQAANPISLLVPATLTAITQTDSQATLSLKADDKDILISAKLVIGADGTNSSVRKLLGITTDTIDYEQSALVTVTHLKRGHNHVAYERFKQEGAIAMLPLLNNCCATIWTDANATINQLMSLNDQDFLATLQSNFGYRLGRLLKSEARHLYPLKKIIATSVLSNRILLIGNAAHTLSPIAAQGLNLAFAEINKLVTTLDRQSLDQLDWKDYLNWQTKLLKSSSQLSHELSRIFSKNNSLINFLRPAGMIGLDLSIPLKNRFALKAMGKHRS
jgi:2-octaprenyl-6-methoxyphenol hydroxylase